eukprot:Em0014g974a
MEEVQRLLQQLAADRVQREREFDEQRKWREEEQVQHGKDRERHDEETRAYLDLIAKLAETRKDGSAKPANLSVKLVPLGAEDDVEAYLVTFERILTAHGIDENRWAHFLAPQLTGKAQLAFAALPTTSSDDYEAIKAAILARYGINEDAYRVRFRGLVRREGETNRETATRLMDLLGKWMKEHQTAREIQQVIGLEQFLNTLPLEKRLWVHERKPKTCVEAGELVDEYEQIRRKEPPVAEAGAKTPKTDGAGRKTSSCTYCGRTGHNESVCRKKPREEESEGPRCFQCRKVGHISRNCPERRALLWREKAEKRSKGSGARQNGICLPGTVEGKKTKILLDTGCSRTMVSNQLVPLENYLEGKGVSVRCAHGDINFYPLAKVEIGVKDLKLIVEAAVAENPTVPVLLGTDVPELFQLLGRQPEETCPQDVLIVMTRARARQQLEEEILRKEKERAAGARPRSIEESSNGSPTLSSEVPKREDPVEPKSKGILDISADELQRLQENDSTLANIRQMVADEARKGEDSEYFMKDGLLSRRWAPYGRKEFEIEQLVLPKQLRRTVLELAHEIPLAGHLEAIPLKSIDAEHVAEKLVELFARVRIPREILTDQGSNFMSQLLVELCRLLHVKPIRTSPYHPQTDGLVERFNQTLKSMLRKATAIDGKDWDKLIPYLLFAYREVPQASTGFSPFELLYGRDVRGPLDILRETWEGNESQDESVVSYVLSTREKLKQMVDCVHENLTKQQDRQKRWYDAKARMREFKPGDLVLVLLPTSTNKLLAQWQGPYQIVTRMGKLNYLLDMHDRRKRQRVFHVNMLKGYQVRAVVEEVEDNHYADELEEDIPVWNEESKGVANFGEELTREQMKELQALLNNFSSVFSDKPGRTNMAEHSIVTDQTLPVRRPPYRLPHAYKELVKKELEDMLENDIIETTSSEWASPIVMVKKKDGSLRMCVDYRRLNAVSHIDAYPMPRIDDLIDGLGNARLISTLDLTRGYWQLPVAEKDRHKTAFTTPYGQFQFKMLPFGLSGAPSSFQRLMDNLIKGCEGFASAYLDDLVVFSNSWQDHLSQLRRVLNRIKEAGLTVKVGKCQFGTSKCVYLGHTVGFETLKQCLCSGPVLRSPDFNKTFVLQTDASDRGVGAVLSQLSDDGEEHPIGYYSRKLLPREERYSTVEKECLAIRRQWRLSRSIYWDASLLFRRTIVRSSGWSV